MFGFLSVECVRQVYKKLSTPRLREHLHVLLETWNSHDKRTVSVVQWEEIVGYVPRELSRIVVYLSNYM